MIGLIWWWVASQNVTAAPVSTPRAPEAIRLLLGAGNPILLGADVLFLGKD